MESISWKDHPSDIICLLATTYQNGELIDCELDTEGGLLKGHRVVLGACSPYLKKILVEHQEKKTILLKQVKYKDMKYILDFIYYGEATLPATDMASLTTTCQFLQIVSLRSSLISHVSGKSVHNVMCERSVNKSLNKREVDLMSDNEENWQTCPRKLYLRKREWLGGHCKNVESQRTCGTEGREASARLQLSDDVRSDSEVDKNLTTNSINENLGREVETEAFAAIPLVAVKMEGLDDVDDLNEDITEERKKDLQEEVDFQTESGIKTELENEVVICENQVSPTKEREREMYSTKLRGGGDVAMVSELSVTCDDTVNSDNSGGNTVEQTEVVKRKFGSVCEVSEFGVQAVSCVNSKNIEEHDGPEVTGIRSDKEVRDATCATELQKSTVPLDRPPLLGRKPCREMETTKDDNSDFRDVRKDGDPEGDLCIPSCKVECGHEQSSSSLQVRGGGSSSEAATAARRGRGGRLCSVVASMSPASDTRSSCVRKNKTKRRRKEDEEEGEDKSYECDICGKSFKIKSRLMPHMRTHTGEKPFDCGICGKSFDAKSRLKPHMRIHTGEKPYVCECCGKSFNQNGGLKVHMRTHTGEKPFPCGDCDAAFIQKYLLEKHVNKFHLKEKPYLCCVCGKSFFTSCSLKRHMVTHATVATAATAWRDGVGGGVGGPATAKALACHVCEKAFAHKSQLKAHMVIHTGERPFACGVCHKTFRQRCSLYAHKKIHTGEKNHRCAFCAKAFIHKEDLKRHVRIHTGESPYPCGVCAKAFKAKNKLKAHMRTHSGEKPFLCCVCGKGLKAKWNLRLHMRTHADHQRND